MPEIHPTAVVHPAAEIADDVSIMKDGEIVENGTVEEIFYHPQHSYTKKLLDAVL